MSTGAEAVENAIKIARQATKRQGVLCFTDAFHGRTLMAMTLTSKVGYKPDCGPVSYTHLRAHETVLDIGCRLLLEKKKHTNLHEVHSYDVYTTQ